MVIHPYNRERNPDELKELCGLCEEENIQFLSDEIYHRISYGTEEATALQFSSKALIINSFSKYYSSKQSCVVVERMKVIFGSPTILQLFPQCWVGGWVGW